MRARSSGRVFLGTHVSSTGQRAPLCAPTGMCISASTRFVSETICFLHVSGTLSLKPHVFIMFQGLFFCLWNHMFSKCFILKNKSVFETICFHNTSGTFFVVSEITCFHNTSATLSVKPYVFIILQGPVFLSFSPCVNNIEII